MSAPPTACTNGQGYREGHPSEGWTVAPDGRRIVRQCRRHADLAVEEYREKLGEVWTFQADPVLAVEQGS